jgi:hypothetical protein
MRQDYEIAFEKLTGYNYVAMQALSNVLFNSIACGCSVEIMMKAKIPMRKSHRKNGKLILHKLIKGFAEKTELKFKYLITEDFIKQHYYGVIKKVEDKEYLNEEQIAIAVSRHKEKVVLDDEALFDSVATARLLGYGTATAVYSNPTIRQLPHVNIKRKLLYSGAVIMKAIENQKGTAAKRELKHARYF